jgi:hypothetical protein
MAEEIGGYFARLRLVVAQDDFNQGMRSLFMLEAEIKHTGEKSKASTSDWKEFTTGLAASIYVIKSVAAAIKELYTSMSSTNAATTKMAALAAVLNVPVADIARVEKAAEIMGVDPSSVAGGLKEAGTTLGLIKQGKLSDEQAKAFTFLGMDYSKQFDKNPVQLFWSTLEAAQTKLNNPNLSQQEHANVYSNLQTILKGGAVELLSTAIASNLSVAKLKELAGKANVLDNKAVSGAVQSTMWGNADKAVIGSYMSQLWGEVGAQMAPALKGLFDYLTANKTDIKTLTTDLAALFGTIFNFVAALIRLGLSIGVFVDKNLHEEAAAEKAITPAQRRQLMDFTSFGPGAYSAGDTFGKKYYPTRFMPPPVHEKRIESYVGSSNLHSTVNVNMYGAHATPDAVGRAAAQGVQSAAEKVYNSIFMQ